MRKIAQQALVAALTATLAVPALAQEGDPAAGEKAFRKCAACHSIEADGPKKVGPSLHDVVGRTTGIVEGFKYSEVMVEAGNAGHAWTPEELAIYLENPKRAMPGNKMTFAGIKKPEELADLIAYLVSVDPDPTGPVGTPAN